MSAIIQLYNMWKCGFTKYNINWRQKIKKRRFWIVTICYTVIWIISFCLLGMILLLKGLYYVCFYILQKNVYLFAFNINSVITKWKVLRTFQLWRVFGGPSCNPLLFWKLNLPEYLKTITKSIVLFHYIFTHV